jgi:hypothetical protein
MNIGHCGRVPPPGGSELHAGRTVSHVEEEAKILEDQKFAILNQLVILEDYVEPSQLKPHRSCLV